MRLSSLARLLLPLACIPLVSAQEPGGVAIAGDDFGDFVEKDFPFFSSTLDCRDLGEGFPKDNLTPRGLILNLGHNLWACFDIDLLRIACIWEGEQGESPITMNALAPGSYHVAGQKTKDGQEVLPKPIGRVWLANGIYPGWQVGDKQSFEDPREPAPSPEEVGRGSLSESHFEAVLYRQFDEVPLPAGWGLTYSVADTEITEWWGTMTVVHNRKHSMVSIHRRIRVQPHDNTFQLILGTLEKDAKVWVHEAGVGNGRASRTLPTLTDDGVHSLAIPPSDKEILVHVGYGYGVSAGTKPNAPIFGSHHWPQTITTHAAPPKATDSGESYMIDNIPIPVPNPWKRNVRLADIDFLDDQGNAVAVTMDGDVWKLSGVKGDLSEVTWKRFASGLHEPMSIVVRDGAPFVFDRNGIWKLVDSNSDGECDRYEMFCNLFAQTAETREFPNSMKLGPDGSFYISKGGQEGTTRGKHNGTVIRVAPDGESFEVVAYGLRQPFIGVNPTTGLVTASDQQGHYVPSTPIHIIRDHRFYGHLPSIADPEKYPETIAEPLTWIPHPVNSSGATQAWASDERMGPIFGEMIHVGYNRPELFRVVMNSRFERPQAAVMSFTRDLDFGPLNAKANPADGQLYVVGFQVWGTTATKISGLARVRYTGKPRVLVTEVTPMDKGVLLKFNAKLDPKLAADPANYSAERWNYLRTEKYGSPHLRPDGETGQEWMTASSAYLSEDGMSVLVGFPDMKAGIHQMRLGWGLKSADGLPAQNAAYFSPWELATFDPKKEGFGKITVDLTPRQVDAAANAIVSAEEGEKLYQMFGCMACHSTDGTLQGKVGPSWKGLYGSEREIAKGEKGKFPADEAYLRESILNPTAKVVKGFEKFDTGMPIYAGILNDAQIESLILYIKSLK